MARQRKYSVSEIDRMRVALERRYPYLWDCHLGLTNFEHDRRRVELEKHLEDMLRTYMLNGSDPEELEAAAAETQQ